MRHLLSSILTVLLMTALQAPSVKASAVVGGGTVPAELLAPDYLMEIVRHLYRWHLDEIDIEKAVQRKDFTFWIRTVTKPLDAGDRSQFAEILVPDLGAVVRVKKADYVIEELNTEVKSGRFKITSVGREPAWRSKPRGSVRVSIPMAEVREYLFRTRGQRDFPTPELIERMRPAVRREVERHSVEGVPAGGAILHFAPISPLANEVWMYWENRRMLIRFASDIDVTNPGVWQHEAMMVKVYNTEEQVVVSHEEAAGSNRFLTRDQVGRALFNCLVLGHRQVVPPAPATTRPAN